MILDEIDYKLLKLISKNPNITKSDIISKFPEDKFDTNKRIKNLSFKKYPSLSIEGYKNTLIKNKILYRYNHITDEIALLLLPKYADTYTITKLGTEYLETYNKNRLFLIFSIIKEIFSFIKP